jgi:hypothetical protein
MRGGWIAAVGLTLLSCALPSRAVGDERRLLVVILDQVTWHDLLDPAVEAPVLRGLAREGAVGMMCARTGRSAAGDGGYLTIGAGSRASCYSVGARSRDPEGYAFDIGEVVEGAAARDVFRSYTGWAVGDNAIVHLRIGALNRQNASSDYRVRPGLLGGTLRRAGLRVACVGNADTARSIHRELVAIGMDEQGLVELGAVGAGLLDRAPRLPYRLTSDPQRVLAALRRVAAPADMIVLELGETSRAAEYAEVLSPESARELRLRAVEQADRLLGSALALFPRSEWGIMVLAPTARAPDVGEEFAALSPVIFVARDMRAGLLSSASTRRAGLVVNTDIAATIIEYFGLPESPETVGRPMTTQARNDDALDVMRYYVGRQDATEACRRRMFRLLPVLAAVGLWSAAFLLLLGDRAPRWAVTLTRGWLVVILAAPAVMLLVPLKVLSASQMVVGIAVGSLLLAGFSGWITGWRSGYAVPALAVGIVLAYDLLRGQVLLEWSPLSYSAASGARFYGIGNEYGGALLACVLLSVAAVLSTGTGSRVTKGEMGAAGVALIGVTWLVGSPRFGANLGMALGCAVGFAVFALYLWRPRPGWREVAIMLVVAVGVAAAAIMAEALVRGAQSSHIGLLASSLRAQGWTALAEVIARKLSMNLTLLRFSLWTDAALAALGVFGVAAAAQPKRVLAALEARVWLMPALVGCGAGAAASFVLNDSGIVAAALVLLYGAGSLAYVGLERP